MSKELQQPRDNNAADPMLGGSAGYPLWLRIRVMDHAAQHGNEAAATRYGVSLPSVSRWSNRIVPFRQTGGAEREDLVETNLLLMAIWFTIWPDATADDTAAFIFNNGGKLYSH